MNDTTTTTADELDAEVAPRGKYDPNSHEAVVRKGDRYVIRGLARLGRFDSVADAWDAWSAHDAERDAEPVFPAVA